MPIYEFVCLKCGRQFETLSAVGEEGSRITCPSCGNVGARKLLSVFSPSGASGAGPRKGGGCGHSHRGGVS